jgi:uncharacterized protein (DUF427 family)
VHAGRTVADSVRAWRVLETSQAPAWYLPPDDVDRALLHRTTSVSFCEWKGAATYWTLRVGDVEARDAAWSYEDPTEPFRAVTGHLAFYPARVDECWVDGQRAVPMPGGFYGGWVTPDVVGPFKGAAGTAHW